MNKTFFSLIAFLFLIAFTSCEKETITQNLETATDVSVTDKTKDLGLKAPEPPPFYIEQRAEMVNGIRMETLRVINNVDHPGYTDGCTGTPIVTWTVHYDNYTPQTDYGAVGVPLEYPDIFNDYDDDGDGNKDSDFQPLVTYTINVYVNYGWDSNCQFHGVFCYTIPKDFIMTSRIDESCGTGEEAGQIYSIYQLTGTNPVGELIACAWGP